MAHFLTAPKKRDADWIDAAPERYRDTLRLLGIEPDAPPRAAEYNERLLEAARRSFGGEGLYEPLLVYTWRCSAATRRR